MQIIRVMKKFNSILSGRQKLRIVELIILMIVGGVMETFSVSLMLPFMNAVMEPDKTMSNEYVSWICDMLDMHSSRSFLFFLAIILALIFLIKNIFLLFEYNIQYKFVYGNMFLMQERLLSSLINKPYEFFLGINSGEIVRIINTDVPQTFLLLTNILMILTEIVVSFALVVTVFAIAPLITLAIAIVLVVLMVIITLVLNPVLGNAGKETQSSSAGMNKWLLQSIQGIKEMKVLQKEDYFKGEFNRFGCKYVLSLRKQYLLSIVPRFIIEAISMSAMFVAVAVLIFNGADLEMIIPILTAVAMAAMRLLPSINRISASLAQVSYNEPMLDKLIESLSDIDNKKVDLRDVHVVEDGSSSAHRIIGFEKCLDLAGITYRYSGACEAILSDTGFSIEKGQSVGIVGSSGAGKTTAVDILLGFLNPEKGQVLIDGVDINEDMPGFLLQVGYIPQSIFMLDDTIRANIAFGENMVSDDEVWRALSDASLFDFVKGLPEGLDTKIGERGMRLSGGQKQRIGIARALYRNPSILVFDEATSALDNETEEAIMKSIDGLKGLKTMIIIAHRLSTIEKCDVVYRVENGKIEREE